MIRKSWVNDALFFCVDGLGGFKGRQSALPFPGPRSGDVSSICCATHLSMSIIVT